MSPTSILVISNIKNIGHCLIAIKEYVKSVLYIHLNVQIPCTPPSLSPSIVKIYRDSLINCREIDVRVLVSPLKTTEWPILKNIDLLLFDNKSPKLFGEIRKKYLIAEDRAVYLTEQNSDTEIVTDINAADEVYDNVVLGGTFDRIHLGHKIMLTEAVLRARKRVVVGITDVNMLKSKILSELILPVDKRISDVSAFLNEIDCTLKFEVVPIQDAFGPTKTDPDMDLIIVSEETVQGGKKVNELRVKHGLKPLQIHCIPTIEFRSDNKHKELKISSSNIRMDLLGTRIKEPEARHNLPAVPYIIGLAGGIGSGKSQMSKRLQKFGASIVDCDKLAHVLYEPEEECYKKIVSYFGEDLVNEDQTINRKKLGDIVFSNLNELEKLNEMVWPKLLILTKQKIQELYEKEKCKVVVIEAAVLLKAGWEKECHEIWSMIIPRKEAIERLKNRNNLTEEEAIKRTNSQLDNESIVSKSNIIFSSQWSHEFTNQQAEKAWNLLMNELDAKS